MKLPANRFSYYLLGALAVLLVFGSGTLTLAGVSEAQPTQSRPKAVLASVRGKASYYGARFHGRKTASGKRFNMNAFVAAHPRWPFGTVVRVTNLRNKRAINVEVIDRGPARSAQRRGVIIDLSRKTAQTLGFVKQGKTDVRLDVLAWGKGRR